MRISIITATYNAAKTLEECMDSVLSQTYEALEYILVDGASTDESLDLIKAKASKHSCIKWVSEPDKGIYDAINKGISMATGDVVGLLHADDILSEPGILKDIMNNFKTEACDGVYGNLLYVAAENTDKVIRNWKSQDFKRNLLDRGWMPAHPTLYLKQEVYANYGKFDTSYNIAADYDFILRIFKQPELRFIYLPKTFVKMRVGGASNRDLKHILNKMQDDLKALRKNQVGGVNTLVKKNLSKIPQFFKK